MKDRDVSEEEEEKEGDVFLLKLTKVTLLPFFSFAVVVP